MLDRLLEALRHSRADFAEIRYERAWITTVAWRDDIKDYEAKGQRYENMQIAFLIGGGVLVLGGATLYVIGRSKKSSTETMALRPAASANSAGVVFSGSW